jgi:tetratricopeptide (TPR) repeat protein
VVALVNLGQHFEALDHGDQAQQVCDRACRIAQVIGDQLGESIARRNLGILKVRSREYKLASEDLTQAARLADAIKSLQLQQTTRIELATALLLRGKLSLAEVTIDGALRYDTPLFSPEAHALRGVIRQRQGKTHEATGSFYDALDKAQVVLKQTARYYRALDVMGLSYSGLTLAEETNDYLDVAVEAYEAVRLIADKPGIVRRRLRLFEALAQSDSGRKLALVRNAIDPEQ